MILPDCKKKVRELEARLAGTQPEPAQETGQRAALTQTTENKQEEPELNVTEEEVETWAQPERPRPAVPATPKTDWAQKAQSKFEQNIATRLPVWIGAISLIFAAFFLVKYSIELGWLRPTVRVSLGGLFGGALLAAGQWIGRREHIANSARIGQGLVGAGLVALYVSIYAAINLYDLLPPLLGFGSMTVVTALAVIMSLRHGQPIAIFGLLGGLLTPALIGSDDPNALAMFGYLFFLFSGMLVGILVLTGIYRL